MFPAEIAGTAEPPIGPARLRAENALSVARSHTSVRVRVARVTLAALNAVRRPKAGAIGLNVSKHPYYSAFSASPRLKPSLVTDCRAEAKDHHPTPRPARRFTQVLAVEVSATVPGFGPLERELWTPVPAGAPIAQHSRSDTLSQSRRNGRVSRSQSLTGGH